MIAFVKIETMTAAVEPHFDAVMDQSFAPHAFARAGLVEQIHRSLFENARADPRLAMLAGLSLDYDGMNSVQMQEV